MAESDINIPDEVADAIARQDHEVRSAAMQRQGYRPPPSWDETTEDQRKISRAHAREMMLVGLKAWLGMTVFSAGDDPDEQPHVILPLHKQEGEE